MNIISSDRGLYSKLVIHCPTFTLIIHDKCDAPCDVKAMQEYTLPTLTTMTSPPTSKPQNLSNSCNIGISDLPDMYAQSPRAAGPRAEVIHMRQITSAYVTTNM